MQVFTLNSVRTFLGFGGGGVALYVHWEWVLAIWSDSNQTLKARTLVMSSYEQSGLGSTCNALLGRSDYFTVSQVQKLQVLVFCNFKFLKKNHTTTMKHLILYGLIEWPRLPSPASFFLLLLKK